jgi:cell division protein FtsQ
MFFRPKKNRRRVDVAKKTGELKAAAKQHAPTALKVLGLLALSTGLTWAGVEGWRWATTTPRLALREVVVSGQARATEAELVRLSGAVLGLNVFALDTAAMERSIGTHPWVRKVRVHRALPSRLLVEVTEHQAVALLALGELYLVDEAGEPFKRLTPGALAQLRRGIDVAKAYGAASSASTSARRRSARSSGEVTDEASASTSSASAPARNNGSKGGCARAW